MAICRNDGVFVDERNNILKRTAKPEIRQTTCSKQRSALREGNGIELGNHGKDTRQKHQEQLNVFRSVVDVVAKLLQCLVG